MNHQYAMKLPVAAFSNRVGMFALTSVVLVLVIAVLFWPRPARALSGQCVWEGGPGAPTYPSCKLEDCMGAGGLAVCTAPEVRPPSSVNDAQVDGQKFQYGACDLKAPFAVYEAAWCAAAGGTYTGTAHGCQNYQRPVTEGDVVSESDRFITILFPSCSPTVSSDSGWGFDDTGDQVCGGSTTFRNGLLMSDVRKRVYAPCGRDGFGIILGKGRALQCPNTAFSRTQPNGNLQCFLPAERCCGIGHQVSPVTGAEMRTEPDYRMGGAGGLELAHYYNSQGRFRLPDSGPFIAGVSDYWHFSYDRHLVAVSGNPELLAIVQREDGTLEAFDGSGHEILNRTGAADVLAGSAGGGWTLTLANSDVESYDSGGRLNSITTRSGIVTTISHGSNGAISQVADSFGHQLTYTSNASNQLISVILPDGQSTVSYGYDSMGRLISVTYPDGTSRSYQYEDPANSWLLSGITDENNQRYMTFRYNHQGLMSHEELAGGVDASDFFPAYLLVANTINATATDPLGQDRSYVLDNSNGVYKLRNSSPYCPDCPNTSQATYDANGNPQSRIDLNNIQTNYVYDLTRNLETSRTDGLKGAGQATTSTRTTATQWHSTFRLPVSISAYTGATATGTPVRTTSYTYDGYGNVLTKTITDGATGATRSWTYTYYNSGLYGQVQTVDGPRTDVNDLTSYTYYNCASGSKCGQVQTVSDALGHTTTFNSYDANGLPLSITDPNGAVTTLTYDSRQHLKTRTTAGELTRFDYYATGLVQKVTLPDGSYLVYIYDAAHRLTEVDDGLGDRIVYTLDGAGNRQQELRYDPSGALALAHTQLYNSLGQLWQDLTSAGTDAQATVYGYDSGGNQTSVQAPLARNTSNLYDELSRLKQVTDPAAGNTGFVYDAVDNLTSVTDPRGLTTQYQYNGLGDLKQVQSPDTGITHSTFDSAGNAHTVTDARSSTATYSYDALNRVTQVAYSDQTFGFTYDQGTNGIGHLSAVSDASGGTSFAYDQLGRVVQKQHTVAGVKLTVGYVYHNTQVTSLTTPSGQVIAYTYNGNNQISSISVNGTNVLGSVQYTPFGPTSGWTWGNGTSATRKFDLDGRIAEISSAGDSTYTFFDDGSISSRSDDSGHDYSVVPGTTTIAINPTNNQIENTTGTLIRTYSYDSAGNTTGNGTLSLTYNGAGRMSSAALGGVSTTFALNALGQRVSKTSTAATTLYAYDEAGHLLGEYTGNGALIQETVWLGDTPVATLRPKAGGAVDIYYVHADHLNTPRRVSRPADNVIVWRSSSDPFGVGFFDQDPDGDGQLFAYNLRFPGQYYDAETGLNYNVNRDYDPAVGRYVESDPIGLSGGSYSTYTYVNDNPLSDWDEEGLAPSGGPYHPPEGTGLKCTGDDSCTMLSGKMWVLMRMINSHQLWDWLNPPPRGGGRHAKEIADLWRAYAKCQSLHKTKCENCPPKSPGVNVMPLPEWTPTPTPAPAAPPLRFPLEPIFLP